MLNHLCRKELAKRLGISQRSLERLWQAGTGPKGLRLGERRIVYPLAEVEAWEATRLFPGRSAELTDDSLPQVVLVAD
jgi:predicted DNA-binding transcriptional regulator AlpA